MKRYLILLCLFSLQAWSQACPQTEKAFSLPPLKPRTQQKDIFQWPRSICETQTPVAHFQVKMVWNPYEELININFKQEFNRSSGLAQPSIEWKLEDMPTDQLGNWEEQSRFEINYEEPNYRDCSYRLQFQKSLPGFLRSQIELNMNCDGVESELTLDCQTE